MTLRRASKGLYKKISRRTFALGVFLVFAGVGAPLAHAWVINVAVSYTPVTLGGNTTISWNGSDGAAESCNLFGPTIGSGTPGAYPNKLGQWSIPGGQTGSVSTGPINGNYTYRVDCYNYDGGGGGGSGSRSITVVPSAGCTTASFGSPWNSNSYLIYSGGKGSISNWYGRYCVTNYSGSAFYIPMATPTEWNNFVSVAPSLNIGVVAY